MQMLKLIQKERQRMKNKVMENGVDISIFQVRMYTIFLVLRRGITLFVFCVKNLLGAKSPS